MNCTASKDACNQYKPKPRRPPFVRRDATSHALSRMANNVRPHFGTCIFCAPRGRAQKLDEDMGLALFCAFFARNILKKVRHARHYRIVENGERERGDENGNPDAFKT
jgi:hypothetical protein